MLGFIVGAVCAIGAVKLARRLGRCHGPFGLAPRGHGCGPLGHRDVRRFGAPRWLLRALFERLETTPGQEKAIVAALSELAREREALREEARRTRADVGRALSAGLVDDAALEETFARHDRLLAQVRVSIVETLKKIGEALDERQRGRLAKLIEGGWRPWGERWGGDDHGSVWA